MSPQQPEKLVNNPYVFHCLKQAMYRQLKRTTDDNYNKREGEKYVLFFLRNYSIQGLTHYSFIDKMQKCFYLIQ